MIKILINNSRCLCPVGFEGKNCMTGPCAKDPCMNNGKCSNTQTSFECDCLDGFSGDRCDITPCSTKPCLNDGESLRKIF